MDKKSKTVQENDGEEEFRTTKTQIPKRKPFKKGPPKEKKVGLLPTVAPSLPQPEQGRRAIDSVRPSTLAIPIKNDPMFDDIDCDDFVGLSELKSQRKFAITNESFLPLVDREYDFRAATDKRFSVIVSKSCYRYVMMIHLYARYAQLRDLRGIAERDEINLLTYLKGKAYVLPPAIDIYLRSIGDFSDASGKHHRIEFPVWLNANGDFGRVDANTHWKYMSYPAPRIFVLAVIADLRYSTGADTARDWDLLADLRPAAENNVQPGLPTVNLLGWSRANILSSDQRTHVENAGVSIDDFGGRERFLIDNLLIEKVHDALNNSSTKLKLGNGLCERPNGSIGQLLYYQRDMSEDATFSRTEHYLEAEIRGVCVQQLDRRVAMYGQVFNFRVQKDHRTLNGKFFFIISTSFT